MGCPRTYAGPPKRAGRMPAGVETGWLAGGQLSGYQFLGGALDGPPLGIPALGASVLFHHANPGRYAEQARLYGAGGSPPLADPGIRLYPLPHGGVSGAAGPIGQTVGDGLGHSPLAD